MAERILVINPGSTSTKISVFDGEVEILSEKIHHSVEELRRFRKIYDQKDYRKGLILEAISRKSMGLEEFDAFVGRGGLLCPLEGGTYVVDERMLEDLREAKFGEHASNLGAVLAYELAKGVGKPAFIVDPVVVDEMEDIARLSGMPEVERKSIFHALNQRAVARKVAKALGRRYEDVNLVVAHLGGGISVGAHRRGKVVDVNNALDGEGPFSPERSGGVPVGDLLKLAFSGKYDFPTLYRKIVGGGGLVAYLGTNDAREVREMVERGDEKARFVVEAMAYQIAKEIGARAAALYGRVDAIVITGGLAHFSWLVERVKERVEFIAPVFVIPGEAEMEALALGALRVLRGEEEAKMYRCRRLPEFPWKGQ